MKSKSKEKIEAKNNIKTPSKKKKSKSEIKKGNYSNKDIYRNNQTLLNYAKLKLKIYNEKKEGKFKNIEENKTIKSDDIDPAKNTIPKSYSIPVSKSVSINKSPRIKKKKKINDLYKKNIEYNVGKNPNKYILAYCNKTSKQSPVNSICSKGDSFRSGYITFPKNNIKEKNISNNRYKNSHLYCSTCNNTIFNNPSKINNFIPNLHERNIPKIYQLKNNTNYNCSLSMINEYEALKKENKEIKEKLAGYEYKIKLLEKRIQEIMNPGQETNDTKTIETIDINIDENSLSINNNNG